MVKKTKSYKCPKCSGSDYFIGQRNIVSGVGWTASGQMREYPICRTCDEIMYLFNSKEDLERKERFDSKFALYLRIGIIAPILITFIYALITGQFK